jgi:hypothetical protein
MTDVDPRLIWPDLKGWTDTGWREGVVRARDAAGAIV